LIKVKTNRAFDGVEVKRTAVNYADPGLPIFPEVTGQTGRLKLPHNTHIRNALLEITTQIVDFVSRRNSSERIDRKTQTNEDEPHDLMHPRNFPVFS